MEVAYPRTYPSAYPNNQQQDRFTEVSYQHDGGRGARPQQPTLGGACCGAVFGAVLLLAATVLLWTNEGVAVRQQQLLTDASSSIDSGAGGLVHVVGSLKTNAPLRDADWALTLDALALDRTVEVYQWKEKKEQHERKVDQQTTRTETTYSYHREWVASGVSSSGFKHPNGHDNPSWDEALGEARQAAGGRAFAAQSQRASSVTLDGLKLTPTLLAKAERFEALEETPAALAELLSDTRAKASGAYVYSDAKRCMPPHEPQVGCARLSWRHAPLHEVSVLAKKKLKKRNGVEEATLMPWPSRAAGAGYELALLSFGDVEPEAMIAGAESENTLMLWLKRGGGILLTWIGWGLLFGPAQYLASWIPLLGGLVGCALGAAAFGAALAHSLSVIAVAWVAQRPLVAGTLLMVVATSVYVGVGALRGRKAGGGGATSKAK